ncbi:uncharacterized protein B0H18DRAFT_986557 [Fomitopsis serialis]|uniref:uncharacterized protein n=1 Tax=Fomitopsis serialis TaxID=139415 RepID=UPI002008BF2B|nr:uncharacterized protein B0H18DRAFT_986557 [Neoantrodia serialis]KAH9932603.1 hypothetical protein B0H18DRAFT_986557 [Neoantrodia serialis]
MQRVRSPEQRDQGLNDFMASLPEAVKQYYKDAYLQDFPGFVNECMGSPKGKTDAWWLNNFCVHPERQRQGIGRRLLEIVRQKVDSHLSPTCEGEGQVVALSATRDVNAPVYKAYGFEQKGLKKMLSPWGDWPLYVFVLDAGCQ